MHHLLQTLKHRLIVAHGLGHAACQAVAQRVIDVEFARGSRCQERIVETYSGSLVTSRKRIIVIESAYHMLQPVSHGQHPAS